MRTRRYALLGHSHPPTAGELAFAVSGTNLAPVLAFDVPHLMARLMAEHEQAAYDLIVIGPTLTDERPQALVETVSTRSGAAIIVLSDHTDNGSTTGHTTRHLPRTTPATVVAMHAAALVARQPPPARAASRSAHAWGPLHLDASIREIRWHSSPVEMTAAQFEIIRLLIEAQGAVVTVAALGRHLYERALTTDAERIRAHILRIRRRLAQVSPDAGRLVRTVRAVGYRLEPSAEQTSTSSAGRGHAGPSTAGRTHK